MKGEAAILTLNAGSSSLKFALFDITGCEPVRQVYGGLFELDSRPHFTVFDTDDKPLFEAQPDSPGHEAAIAYLLDWLARKYPDIPIIASGHRVVHGGSSFETPVLIDASILQLLRQYIPLAPLHMPHNLAAIEILHKQRPGLPQVACFDTAFHRTMTRQEQGYALPRQWFDQGLRRYGFHGLSYEYIASVLPRYLGEAGEGRVIVAHLGHGASLCAMHKRRSVATTMGFTPLDGIPMATRPGELDPGAITWLMREQHLSVSEVDDLLNHHSGLLGLSGISGDMHQLLASDQPEAAAAIDYFVHHTQRAIGSLAAVLGGLDALVFTAGIGENAPAIRERICHQSAWLGIQLDSEANRESRPRISPPDSAVSVWRIPTNEELIIARHTAALQSAGLPERSHHD
ncbi:MAG: acetate/propionate family kinase [Gammaproteobacteria bacterium]